MASTGESVDCSPTSITVEPVYEKVAISIPQTGDDSNMILWSALACISMLGMTTLARKRKDA